MKVDIQHKVDRIVRATGEIEQEYNHFAYEFQTGDHMIRARTYTDTIKQVSILGRLGLDGSPPATLEAMDPRHDPEFGEVLAYLRDRFDEIQILGPEGYQVIARGFSQAELAEREATEPQGYYQTVNVDLDLDGDHQ